MSEHPVWAVPNHNREKTPKIRKTERELQKIAEKRRFGTMKNRKTSPKNRQFWNRNRNRETSSQFGSGSAISKIGTAGTSGHNSNK